MWKDDHFDKSDVEKRYSKAGTKLGKAQNHIPANQSPMQLKHRQISEILVILPILVAMGRFHKQHSIPSLGKEFVHVTRVGEENSITMSKDT